MHMLLYILLLWLPMILYVFFFKQKTAYEMRISDWSSDVCSSDLESALQQVLEETDALDVSHPQIYRDDSWRQPFKRLRAEHPVYYCPQSRSGPYWSISRYADIVRVDTDPLSFSSSYLHGGVTIEARVAAPFMQMDPPVHTENTKKATPNKTKER